MNKIAFIDLATREVQVGDIPTIYRERFLGGRGINTFLLYNYTDRGTNPLGPENPLIVGSGLLTGLPDMGASRVNFSAKSPETGHLGDSAMGGYFGAELRFAGFDHLVIKDKAAQPTYIFIHDGKIDLRDARHLAGLDTAETQNAIKQELGDPRVQVACIGEAGRRMIAYACIMHGVSYSAGRTGMGAVMGSKNLWAIAARGTGSPRIADPPGMLDAMQRHYNHITKTKGFLATSIYGTLIRLNNTRTQGYEGGLNHQYNMMELGGEELDAEVFLDRYESGKASCFNCPAHCKHLHKFKRSDGTLAMSGGPEYYGAGGWGSQCGSSSWETILTAWQKVNTYGIDVGSVTAYTAWLMELYQNGILTDDDVDFPLKWGSSEAILGIIDLMAKGEGKLGNLLKGGWIPAAKKIGKGCEYYMDHVKGLTIECDDVRGHRAQVLGLATSSRGADHLRSRYTLEEFALPPEVSARLTGRAIPSDPASYDGKEWACFWTENICSLADALGICKFLTKWLSTGLMGISEFRESVEAVTGIKFTEEDLWEIAERIYNVERLFLVREGMRRRDDAPPPKFYKPWTHGPRAGTRVEPERFQGLLDRYYQLHGWDREGMPTKETLSRLKLTPREKRLPITGPKDLEKIGELLW